ncbi:FecR family protein [candidate division KSB1 bacterium]
MDPSSMEILIARYLSGECTEHEKETVIKLLEESADEKQIVEILKRFWNVSETGKHEFDAEAALRKLKDRSKTDQDIPISKIPDEQLSYSERRRNLRRRSRGSSTFGRFMKYAAVLILCVLVPYFVLQKTNEQPAENLIEVYVENGETKEVLLPDGSEVLLDAGSILTYPEEFQDTREITLTGEGYFEVVRNPEKPFEVQAQHAVIKVLGTKFNVRAWDRTEGVKVAVSEGRVSLQSAENANRDPVIITANQVSFMGTNGSISAPVDVNIDNFLSWANRDLEFHDVYLKEIISQLERWYDLRIVFENESLLALKVSMHVNRRPLPEILELIAAMSDQEFEKTDNKVRYFSK